MGAWSESIGHNIRGLARLSGRDRPGQFWPWAGTVFGVAVIADMALVIPVIGSMFVRMANYLRDHPEGFPKPLPGQAPTLPPELLPDFGALVVSFAVVGLVSIALLVASVARRLHDRDRTGWWGALPLPFHAIGFAMAPAAMTAMRGGEIGLYYRLASLNSLLFWGAFIALVVLLIGSGTEGPNRYGEDPRTGA